jgi:hypothetical protein
MLSTLIAVGDIPKGSLNTTSIVRSNLFRIAADSIPSARIPNPATDLHRERSYQCPFLLVNMSDGGPSLPSGEAWLPAVAGPERFLKGVIGIIKGFFRIINPHSSLRIDACHGVVKATII